MSDNELLLAISDLMDVKLCPVNDRLDRMERRMDSLEQHMESLEQRMDSLEQRMDSLEQRMDGLEQRMDSTEQRLKRIELTQENIILPRLQNIEVCYTSTYKRYREGVDQIVSMQADVDVIKTTITNHSEILQRLA